jgi:hypothetical protein
VIASVLFGLSHFNKRLSEPRPTSTGVMSCWPRLRDFLRVCLARAAESAGIDDHAYVRGLVVVVVVLNFVPKPEYRKLKAGRTAETGLPVCISADGLKL